MGVEEQQARDFPVRLWRCPECRAEAFWPAEPLLPGGPALCGHPSSGYVSALYVPAVLSEGLVEKVARAWAEEIGGGGLFAPDAEFPGEAERNTVFRQGLLRDTRVLLRAAGFVSEPSTGGE